MSQSNTKHVWEQATYDSLERMASEPPMLFSAMATVMTEEPLITKGFVVDVRNGSSEIDLGAWCPRLA